MSLEQVRDDIEKEARARAEEIRSQAEERAEEIISAAEADAEEIKSARAEEVEAELDQQREQSLSSAKLEAKQQRLEARRELLDRVRTQVKAELAGLDEEKRESLTRTLIESAVAEFDDGATISVYGRSEDEALIEEILTEYDDCRFAGEYDCVGGVVVESEGSRVRVNNTFDSVLDDVWEENLKELSTHLFEQ